MDQKHSQPIIIKLPRLIVFPIRPHTVLQIKSASETRPGNSLSTSRSFVHYLFFSAPPPSSFARARIMRRKLIKAMARARAIFRSMNGYTHFVGNERGEEEEMGTQR